MTLETIACIAIPTAAIVIFFVAWRRRSVECDQLLKDNTRLRATNEKLTAAIKKYHDQLRDAVDQSFERALEPDIRISPECLEDYSE